MKRKDKSKSKSQSVNKKAKKELQIKLVAALTETISQFGTIKKSSKVITKFAKQISKKISVTVKDDSITPFIKAEEAKPAVKEKPVAAPKAKAPIKKEVSE